MRSRWNIVVLLVGVSTLAAAAQSNDRPRTSTFALEGVRLIDGTGGPARDGQTIVVDKGRIRIVGPATSTSVPAGVEVLHLDGRTVIPGLVGMHEHLFYQLESPESGQLEIRAQSTFAKLYLAAGVTTIRTGGTIDFEGDLRLKQRIDAGQEPGPTIHLTSGYITGATPKPDPAGVARQIERYADAGATSIKAYTTLRATELQAVIAAAHRRGLRVTGHLCAVGFREAAALGIDNIEHGLPFDTEFYSQKRLDECPDQNAVFAELAYIDVGDPRIRQTIDVLISNHVAITSTLAVLESYAGTPPDRRVRSILASSLVDTYDAIAAERANRNSRLRALLADALHKEMEFERAFDAAGGTLLAGVDPTGWGGVIAGFGDQREVELLVASGLSPEKAIQIATSNGAQFLREKDIGTIAEGSRADLLVVRGNPAQYISDIRNVDVVFKEGVAYDPSVLIAAAQGTLGVGQRPQMFTWTLVAIGIVAPALVVVRLTKRRRR
jgi:imidazolonepropionase-like amidohydrolase